DFLYHHVSGMIQSCRQREVPVMVCTLPSNERDLAPIGQDASDPTMEAAVTDAMRLFEVQPGAVIERLIPLLEAQPDHARAHFYLGKALYATGQYASALPHFIRARDLDPMPWRAPALSQDAIRRAVEEQGASLCDAEAVFRMHSPGGAIGWELMDDHVHPSLQGQALLARSIVQTLTNRTDSLAVDPDTFDTLPDWERYAARLGDNPYDRYAVAHSVRVLFDIPFMRASNPQALQRFERMVRQAEQKMPDDILAIARKWQTKTPHAGGKRPIAGMVARGLLRRNEIEKALPLFDVARRSVPVYSSWHLEYVYFWLVARQLQNGALEDDEYQLAGDEIERGRILLQHGYSESGITERYLGRLHQLRGEFAEAIPLLETARKKLYGLDRVATEKALIVSYLKMNRPEMARKIAETGVEHSGGYADLYRNMLQDIESSGISDPSSQPSPASVTPTENLSD
ncbi:MAG TPA: tetratricopeptide repeat protein, partial [Pontiella sp.]|nr:tetratricopeptide repeat protein [Pontiella sp.]